jgi:hypothetical protein
VTRRPFALVLAALVASLVVILGACSSAPPAPALTDPKEILTKAVTSLTGVKTFEFTSSFTGTAKIPQVGDIDLSTVKLTGALDASNKKAKISFDAPTFLGTKIDALLIDTTAYYKVAGPLAIALRATSDKFTKVDVPTSSGNPSGTVTDLNQAVAQIQQGLDKLPQAPVKQADEKCGDQDCYHVTIKLSAADLKSLDPTSTLNGDVALDFFTRKSDYRPARIAVGVTTTDMGTFGMTFDLTYDVSVSVDAPPADQVTTP